jgi:hypothetical protein
LVFAAMLRTYRVCGARFYEASINRLNGKKTRGVYCQRMQTR